MYFQMTKEILNYVGANDEGNTLIGHQISDIYHAENYVLGSFEQQQRYTKAICIIFGDDRIQCAGIGVSSKSSKKCECIINFIPTPSWKRYLQSQSPDDPRQ